MHGHCACRAQGAVGREGEGGGLLGRGTRGLPVGERGRRCSVRDDGERIGYFGRARRTCPRWTFLRKEMGRRGMMWGGDFRFRGGEGAGDLYRCVHMNTLFAVSRCLQPTAHNSRGQPPASLARTTGPDNEDRAITISECRVLQLKISARGCAACRHALTSYTSLCAPRGAFGETPKPAPGPHLPQPA